MKKEKLESAFPMMYDNPGCRGMSKRFYAACAAMQGILANYSNERMVNGGYIPITEYKEIIEQSYGIADELLTQENE